MTVVQAPWISNSEDLADGTALTTNANSKSINIAALAGDAAVASR
jgi:hypothetical protein